MNTETVKYPAPEHRCAKCGALMTARTLRGLCPNCLALFAFASDKSDTSDAPGTEPARPALSATLRYIGDYELQEEIGRGGMGVVFRARQAGLNRTVAVKMIIAGEFAGPAERKRFQREAEAAAQLRHPNIVAIHEVGEHEGRSYFSMDFIEGKTLSALLKEGPLPPARVAALVKTLAEAVHFAHQRGTLHRDLKPQNILIGTDGQPHILDFGLARPVEREAGLTRTGDVMGSPSYMPPEQASGRISDIGPASDVYALGAILYEAIAGRPPFTGETAMEVLTQVVNQDPAPLRKLHPNVPADLETICLKCLEKRPERRYHSARALVEELERFLNFEPILARPAGRLRKGWSWMQRNPWVFAAGLGFVALVLICLAYGLWEKTQLLRWRMEVGKEKALPSNDLLSSLNLMGSGGGRVYDSKSPGNISPGGLFLTMAPGAYFFLYFVGRSFRKSYKRQSTGGAAISQRVLLLHAAAGVAAAMAGMVYLLLQIRSWVWQGAAGYMGFEIPGVVCALMLDWVGFRMTWEAVGILETSRYRILVQRSLDRQLKGDAWRAGLVLAYICAAFWLWAMSRFLYSMMHILDSGTKKAALGYLLSVVLSIGLTALVTWAIRKRRRLFTFVCVPLVLVGIPFVFMALMAEDVTTRVWLVLGLVSAAIQACVTLLLFKTGETERRRFPVNPWLDIGLGVVFAGAVFALLHVVEDWRGKTAWEKTKSKLEAKGAKLDWAAYIPPPIPDDQNIFKAPYMQEAFTGRGTQPWGKMPKPGENMSLPRAPWDNGGVWNGTNYVPWPSPQPFYHPASNVTVAIVTLALTGEAPANGATVLRYDDPESKARAAQLISNTVGPMTAIPQGFPLVNRATSEIQPVRIILEYNRSLSDKEVASFLPKGLAANTDPYGVLQVESNGPISFRASAGLIIPAQDVLAWFEAVQPQLEFIRQALRRPLARPEGDYQNPYDTPIPNFVSIRTLSQMLGAGAQSYLLLGEPDKALAQLSFMHDLRRLMQGPPGGQPENLVAAMMNVGVAGLYVNMIADGLRWQAWRDPQLAALEGQLKVYDLPTYVDRAFRENQANSRGYLERTPRAEMMGRFFHADANKRVQDWDDFRWNLLFHIMPRGWFYQNEATFAKFVQPYIEAFSLPQQTIQPRQFDGYSERVDKIISELGPYTWFMDIALPNFTRAYNVTAHNQTSIGQARIACALERYRLAQHEYPESLDALVPQYLDQIPHDIIGGQSPVYQRGSEGGFQLSSAGWKEKERWTWPPPP